MPEMVLTLPSPHDGQRFVLENRRRFNVVVCGRRWGKSLMAASEIAIPTALEGGPVAWFAPNYKYLLESWRMIVSMLRPVATRVSEQEKRIEFSGGGLIEFWSCLDPDSGRGRRYRVAIVDEAGFVDDLMLRWNTSIRPTLTDFRGDAWFFGTPSQSDDFQKLFLFASSPSNSDTWAAFTMPTSTNPHIDRAEIEEARKSMPDAAFRQEYMAEFVVSGTGVLWEKSWIDDHRITLEELNRVDIREIAIGLDPSFADPEKHKNPYKAMDECGIVVCASDWNKRGYVLADCSAVMHPADWARKVVELSRRYSRSKIVYESNAGGELIRMAILAVDPHARLVESYSSGGKRARAEPVAIAYSQGRVRHLGEHPALEAEMLSWDSTNPRVRSPNRLDALCKSLNSLRIDQPEFGIRHVIGHRSFKTSIYE